MLDNIEAVIFDLDGTLVDSMWMWKSIDIEYLGKFNIEIPSDLQIAIEGMSFSETAIYFKERFNIPDSLEKIKLDWNNMAWDKYKNEVTLKEGAIDFLKYLKSNQIKTAIATSNSRELAMLCLESLHIDKYIDVIKTSCEAKKGKPAPDIYLLAAKSLEVLPRKCLAFEDIPYGIVAAKSANMRVCAVDDNYSMDVIEEKKELADYYIYSYNEILTRKYEVLE